MTEQAAKREAAENPSHPFNQPQFEVERIDYCTDCLASRGDIVTYKNHLREYEGKECTGEVIDIIRTYHEHSGTHKEYYIIHDEGRIRSVHHNNIVSVRR